MAYTDRDTVRGVLVPDGVQDGTAASLADEDIDEAIGRVSARVDLHLAAHYPLPFPEPTPAVLRDIATDLAAYDLTLAYYKSVDISDQDPVVRRYRDARGLLQQLSTGQLVIDLPGTDGDIQDDPVVINPEPQPSSPRLGFEVRVIREYGPWGYRYGA